MKMPMQLFPIMSALFLSLLMLSPLANAADAVQVQKDEYWVGPWRLGMTSKQVSAFKSQMPYSAVQIDGTIGTAIADINGKKEKISFAFGDDDRLDYIQNLKYHGLDYSEAKKASLEIFDLFTSRFGGAQIVNINVNGQPILDRGSMTVVMDKLLGSAPALSDKISADAVKEGKKTVTTNFVFDLVPGKQPSNCRLHSQLAYSSKTKMYDILLFLDPVDAKSREVEANINANYDK